MILNLELTKLFGDLGKIIINSHLIDPKPLGKIKSKSRTVKVEVKTPNIFYKKYIITILGEGLQPTQVEMRDKSFKDIMNQAYANYFIHYHESFTYPNYVIDYEYDEFTKQLSPIKVYKSK